jgi:DNA-binding response OmpR family regulator
MKERVLVVDDDPEMVSMVTCLLEADGLSVLTADNGASALLQIESLRPDLVLLDAAMPVMDGFQTIDILRSRGGTAEIPVILLVDVTDDANIFRGWTAAVSLCIIKPFGPGEMLAAVKRVLSCARDSSGRKGHASR